LNPGGVEGSAVLDRDEFAKIRAALGDELVGMMVDRFFEIVPEKVEAACAGVLTGDLKTVERAAHSVLANAGSLGAARLVDLSRKIQDLARKDDGTQLPELTDQLASSLKELRRELNEITRSE
jgi:HPt (histidine-containing phosphotransfer) domain-containing protein